MIWILGLVVAALIFLIVVILGVDREHGEDIRTLRTSLSDLRSAVASTMDGQLDVNVKIRTKIAALDGTLGTINAVMQRLSLTEKEIEILKIRQRSLEKKIIEAGQVKTVNVVIQDPTPKKNLKPKARVNQ